MMYAYAALKLGIPFANGAPNLTCDIPALIELSIKNNTPIAGKDFKTGQTLMKTIIAPGLQARALGAVSYTHLDVYKRQFVSKAQALPQSSRATRCHASSVTGDFGR